MRGITSGGRPCRRPLAAADVASINSGKNGLRFAKKTHSENLADERLYCWQHKDQAKLAQQANPAAGSAETGRPDAATTVEGRTSIDTLADRLGLASINSHSGNGVQIGPSGAGKPRPRRYISFCCFHIPLDEPYEPPARPHPSSYPNTAAAGTHSPRPRPNHGRPPRRVSNRSLIPATASPQTAEVLLAELEKPLSSLDEAGYIYMFWLTPESQSSEPPYEAARSLLVPSAEDAYRRVSDIIASYATGTRSLNGERGKEKKLLLKIGRANNVQRRLNEWQRQCGYDVSLIRFYPYVSSSSADAAKARGGSTARKMPHSHKVERLIHLELAGAGLRVTDVEKCEACGREHREWFQVDATRDAVMQVDEVIRRWSDWDEGLL